jgi:hypothetical protein
MTYFQQMLALARMEAVANARFKRAVESFRESPSQETFTAVAEHVAEVVSPNDDRPECGNYFAMAESPVVTSDLFYTAITEALLGTSGYFATKRDQHPSSWQDSRKHLRRAGVNAQGQSAEQVA